MTGRAGAWLSLKHAKAFGYGCSERRLRPRRKRGGASPLALTQRAPKLMAQRTGIRPCQPCHGCGAHTGSVCFAQSRRTAPRTSRAVDMLIDQRLDCAERQREPGLSTLAPRGRSHINFTANDRIGQVDELFPAQYRSISSTRVICRTARACRASVGSTSRNGPSAGPSGLPSRVSASTASRLPKAASNSASAKALR